MCVNFDGISSVLKRGGECYIAPGGWRFKEKSAALVNAHEEHVRGTTDCSVAAL